MLNQRKRLIDNPSSMFWLVNLRCRCTVVIDATNINVFFPNIKTFFKKTFICPWYIKTV